MITESQIKLLRLMRDKMSKGELSWDDAPAASTYQCSLPHGVVRLSLHDTNPAYVEIEILDVFGRVVDSFTDDDLTASHHQPFRGDSWYVLLLEMYEIARRTALGAEQVVGQIIDDLENSEW